MSPNPIICSSASGNSLCIGATLNDVKDDDSCFCYTNNRFSIGLAIDGVSSGTIRDEGVRCLVKGSIASHSLINYYENHVIPILDYLTASTRDGSKIFSVLGELVAPGEVRASVDRSLLSKILSKISSLKESLHIILSNRKCLAGGQAVFSGVIHVENVGTVFQQAGDTTLLSTLCYLPSKPQDQTPKNIARRIYWTVKNMYTPLPPHTFEGDPTNYVDTTITIKIKSIPQKITIAPSIALIPYQSITRYKLPDNNLYLITLLHTDGFNGNLPINLLNKEKLNNFINNIYKTRNISTKIFRETLNYINIMEQGINITINQLITMITCTLLATESSPTHIKTLIKQTILFDEFTRKTDDKTLIIHITRI